MMASALMVGTTGFEPVTSTVMPINGPKDLPRASPARSAMSTMGPDSQYRGKFMFYPLTAHQRICTLGHRS